MLDRLVRNLVVLFIILALGPSLIAVIGDILSKALLSPPPLTTTSAPAGSDFGAGILVTLITLLLMIGILVRLGRALRNPEAARYRAALDRRSRTLPRYVAERDEVPIHTTGAAPVDPDPELSWDAPFPKA